MPPAHRDPRHDLKARARKQISLLPFYFCLLNSGRKNITMKRILTSKAYALIVCTLIAAAFGVGSAMAATPEPKEAKVTELFSKDLPECPGKEGLMITLEYPPGSVDPIHRHPGHG